MQLVCQNIYFAISFASSKKITTILKLKGVGRPIYDHGPKNFFKMNDFMDVLKTSVYDLRHQS